MNHIQPEFIAEHCTGCGNSLVCWIHGLDDEREVISREFRLLDAVHTVSAPKTIPDQDSFAVWKYLETYEHRWCIADPDSGDRPKLVAGRGFLRCHGEGDGARQAEGENGSRKSHQAMITPGSLPIAASSHYFFARASLMSARMSSACLAAST